MVRVSSWWGRIIACRLSDTEMSRGFVVAGHVSIVGDIWICLEVCVKIAKIHGYRKIRIKGSDSDDMPQAEAGSFSVP